MQRSALFPLLGAIAVPLIANAVHTDREQLAERTQALVDAVAREPIDAAAMSGLLDENVTFFLMNRDQIIAMAQRASAKYNIQAGSITALEARVDAPDAGQIWFAIYVRIRSDGGEFPTKSQWLLHWRKSAGLWRVSEIQMISVNDQPARKAYLP
ncbi:MAG: hypothetical protein GC162_20120 [Planctomycetes bacterium]|nr:hypothetical protein [Planctomycetota bacterium]